MGYIYEYIICILYLINIHINEIAISENKEAMNLLDSRERYVRGLRGKKR